MPQARSPARKAATPDANPVSSSVAPAGSAKTSSFQCRPATRGPSEANSGSPAAAGSADSSTQATVRRGARTTRAPSAWASSWPPRQTPRTGTPAPAASRSRIASAASEGSCSRSSTDWLPPKLSTAVDLGERGQRVAVGQVALVERDAGPAQRRLRVPQEVLLEVVDAGERGHARRLLHFGGDLVPVAAARGGDGVVAVLDRRAGRSRRASSRARRPGSRRRAGRARGAPWWPPRCGRPGPAGAGRRARGRSSRARRAAAGRA